MKKTTFFFAVLIALASCKKEEPVAPQPQHGPKVTPYTLTVGISTYNAPVVYEIEFEYKNKIDSVITDTIAFDSHYSVEYSGLKVGTVVRVAVHKRKPSLGSVTLGMSLIKKDIDYYPPMYSAYTYESEAPKTLKDAVEILDWD